MLRIPRRHPPAALLHVHLLECVPHDDFEHLQRRLAYEAASRGDGRITLLLAEHPLSITLGRSGTREHISGDDETLAQPGCEPEYVARGGGAIVHGPGQLAVALVTPLGRLRWSVGNYLNRLQQGLSQTLAALGMVPRQRTERCGVWGRSGLLAAVGIQVRHDVATFGAWLNIHPVGPPGLRVISAAGDPQPFMGSLLAEKVPAGRIFNVRGALPEHLAQALACERRELFTGHPLLPLPEKHVARLIA